MRPGELIFIVDQIQYKPGWEIVPHIVMEHDSGLITSDTYLQVECSSGVDAVTGEPCSWKGRKQRISPWMCKQEIIGICFALIRDAEEHEMREWFRYKGAAIYNPHLDPDALVEVASKKANFNYREDSMDKA